MLNNKRVAKFEFCNNWNDKRLIGQLKYGDLSSFGTYFK